MKAKAKKEAKKVERVLKKKVEKAKEEAHVIKEIHNAVKSVK